MPEPTRKGEIVYRGIPVSAGVARGKIFVLGKSKHSVHRKVLPDPDLPGEVSRLQKALVQTRQEILEVQRKVTESMGASEGDIFNAHLLVLEDSTLIDGVVGLIEKEKVNAEYAFQTVAEDFTAKLAAIADEYLRERAGDMRDVTSRVLNQLLGKAEDFNLRDLKEPVILISHDLSPSITAQMERSKVLGFATDVGSKTSHTAIMARSLRIPGVVGLRIASEELQMGQYALLDGYHGSIIVNPSDQTLFEYGQLIRKQVSLEEKLRDVAFKPAVTLDGNQVTLSANIEQADDVDAVTASGAEGVGLFRTEYLFIGREQLPTEEQQFQEYAKVAAALKPQAVVIRTLDLGGDKFLSHLQVPAEMNPFLGWRAIRYCLQEKDIFRVQIRAILRASAHGNVKMMYPMISGLDELNQANALVAECQAELRREGIPFDDKMDIGAMIEIPSAALIADALAKRVKFFSLGTNDLIQYTLAVDRMNEKIAHLYEPTHPAIVRLIKATVDAARNNKIWVSVCGEMAGDPLLTGLLIGLGVDELSTAPSLGPQIKYMVRRLKSSETRSLAEFALACESPAEILNRCEALAEASAPGLFANKP